MNDLIERLTAHLGEKRAFYPGGLSAWGSYPGIGGMPVGMGLGGYGMGGFNPAFNPAVNRGYYPHALGMGGMPYGGMGFHGFGGMGYGGMGYGGMGYGGMGYGGFGMARDEDSLRDEYEQQVEGLKAMAGSGMGLQQYDRMMNRLNTEYGRRLQNIRHIQQRYGPGSQRGRLTGPPGFRPYGASYYGPPSNPYMGGYGGYGGYGYNGSGGLGLGLGGNPYSANLGYGPSIGPGGLNPSDRLRGELASLRSQKANLSAGVAPGAPVSREDLEDEWNKLNALASRTSLESTGVGNLFGSRPGLQTYKDPLTGTDRSPTFGSAGLWSGEGSNTGDWRAFQAAWQKYQTKAKLYNKWLQEQRSSVAPSMDSDIARYQSQLVDADRREQLQQQRFQQRDEDQWQQAQAWRQAYMPRPAQPVAQQPQASPLARALQPAPHPAAPLPQPAPHPVSQATPGLRPAASAARPSGFLDRLAQAASQSLTKEAISTGMVVGAPLGGALGGAVIGGLTAPGEYAPEGVARGLNMGIRGGVGAALGYYGGGALGHGLDKLHTAVGGGSGFGLMRYKTLGRILGTLAGAIGGGVSGHRDMKAKPWDVGEVPWLDRLDANLRQRHPGPPFTPGYMAPSPNLSDTPKLAAAKAAGLLGHDDDDDRARGLQHGALVGSALGSAGGAGIGALAALLKAALTRGHGHIPDLRSAAYLGSALGAAGGAGVGAYRGYEHAKNAASARFKVTMPQRSVHRRRKPSPALDDLDTFMDDLSRKKASARLAVKAAGLGDVLRTIFGQAPKRGLYSDKIKANWAAATKDVPGRSYGSVPVSSSEPQVPRAAHGGGAQGTLPAALK